MYNVSCTALLISLFKIFYAFNHIFLMLFRLSFFYFIITSTRDKHWKFRAGWNHFGSLLRRADALWIIKYHARIRVQITMASISIGWAWPSQTHFIRWDINAGLESSAGLNSWAYVRAYARVCTRVWHTRVCARKNVRQNEQLVQRCTRCSAVRAHTRSKWRSICSNLHIVSSPHGIHL